MLWRAYVAARPGAGRERRRPQSEQTAARESCARQARDAHCARPAAMARCAGFRRSPRGATRQNAGRGTSRSSLCPDFLSKRLIAKSCREPIREIAQERSRARRAVSASDRSATPRGAPTYRFFLYQGAGHFPCRGLVRPWMTGENDHARARRNLHIFEMIEGKMRHHRGFEARGTIPPANRPGAIPICG